MTELLLAILIGVSQPQTPKILPTETPQVTPVPIFDQIWGSIAPEARKIQWCESRGNPNAIDGIHIGLFQIDYKIWGKEYGVSRKELFDPETNWRIGKKIYDRSNSWVLWSCTIN